MIPPELLHSIEHDEEVKRRIRALVLLAVDEAFELLTSGSPAIKQNVMRTLLPAAVRVAQQNEQDEELNQLRQQMAELITEVRNSNQPNESNTPHLQAVDSD